MPARAERLYLYPDLQFDQVSDSGHITEFPTWWDRREFFSKFKSREVDCSNPVDQKSAFLLHVDETLAFDKECMEQLAMNLETFPAHLRDRQAELADLLHKSKWVIVESYEWS